MRRLFAHAAKAQSAHGGKKRVTVPSGKRVGNIFFAFHKKVVERQRAGGAAKPGKVKGRSRALAHLLLLL
jgi:hypothetical protein